MQSFSRNPTSSHGGPEHIDQISHKEQINVFFLEFIEFLIPKFLFSPVLGLSIPFSRVGSKKKKLSTFFMEKY
jgi:hypothetical protein